MTRLINSDIKELFTWDTGAEIQDLGIENNAAIAMPVIHKESKNIGVLVAFSSKYTMTYEIAAHEASHAAKYLFKHINADVDPHEPFEYVVGWIAKCIEEVKKKRNKITTRKG